MKAQEAPSDGAKGESRDCHLATGRMGSMAVGDAAPALLLYGSHRLLGETHGLSNSFSILRRCRCQETLGLFLRADGPSTQVPLYSLTLLPSDRCTRQVTRDSRDQLPRVKWECTHGSKGNTLFDSTLRSAYDPGVSPLRAFGLTFCCQVLMLRCGLSKKASLTSDILLPRVHKVGTESSPGHQYFRSSCSRLCVKYVAGIFKSAFIE